MKTLAQRILSAPLGKTWLFSVGQAGYILKSASGQLLAVDLYLSDCVEPAEGHIGFKRLLPKLLEPEELALDVVIATHPHLDHFDYDSMAALTKPQNTKLFASVGCRKMAENLHIPVEKVFYTAPGDTAVSGDFAIRFIRCDHGPGAPDAFGVVIRVDGKVICEAGDTCLHGDYLPDYRIFGTPDVLIAPINGAYGNLNEEECAALSGLVRPRLTIPCHYGMFASHGGNPGRFYEIMTRQYTENPFLLMAQGEACLL